MYPIVLGLDRLETASFLRSNCTFQYLNGLPSFPDPQTLRRFLHHAPGQALGIGRFGDGHRHRGFAAKTQTANVNSLPMDSGMLGKERGVLVSGGENDVTNGYENHYAGFDSGPADCLNVFAFRRELRTPAG